MNPIERNVVPFKYTTDPAVGYCPSSVNNNTRAILNTVKVCGIDIFGKLNAARRTRFSSLFVSQKYTWNS